MSETQAAAHGARKHEEVGRKKDSEYRQGAASLPRVLHVVASPSGTAEFGYVDRLVRGLVRIEPGRVGVALPAGDALAAAWREEGIEVHEIELRGRSPAAVLGLARVIRSGGYRVVHSHGRYAGVHARLAAKLTGAFAVHACHGLRHEGLEAGRRRWIGAAERGLSALSSYTVCLTGAEKDEVLRGGFGAAERIVVIPDGIDAGALDGIAPEPLPGHPEGALAFGSAGRLASWRRPDLAARAFARVLDGGVDARFYWLDDGGLAHDEARSALEAALAADSRARERFHVLPSAGRVEARLARLDGFVSASEREDFPWWPLVAMARGVPCVLTRAPGNADLAVDGRSALYCEAGDEAALAREMARLAGEKDLAARVGAGGRARAREVFTVQRLVEATANLYRRFGEGGVRAQGAPVPTR